MRHKNIIFAASIVSIVFLLLGYGLFVFFKDKKQDKQDFRNVAVEVEEARYGIITKKVTAVGSLKANKMVVVRPEIQGVIERIHVQGGQIVRKGDILFSLKDDIHVAKFEDAKARLNLAQLQIDRASQLANQKFGTTEKRDQRISELKVAEASFKSAQANLDKTLIRAPFDGLAGLHDLSIGASIDPNKELLTLVDLTPMKVDFDIPSSYLRGISPGQKIKVFVDGQNALRPIVGTIVGIDSVVDPRTHSIHVRAIIDNKKGLFKPGLFAKVELVAGSKDNALIVPFSALEKSGDIDFVYKVQDGVAIRQQVISGLQEGQNVEILMGLKEGDHVITAGQSKIRSGYPVRYALDGVDYPLPKEASQGNSDKKTGDDPSKDVTDQQDTRSSKENSPKEELTKEQSREEKKDEPKDASDNNVLESSDDKTSHDDNKNQKDS